MCGTVILSMKLPKAVCKHCLSEKEILMSACHQDEKWMNLVLRHILHPMKHTLLTPCCIHVRHSLDTRQQGYTGTRMGHTTWRVQLIQLLLPMSQLGHERRYDIDQMIILEAYFGVMIMDNIRIN